MGLDIFHAYGKRYEREVKIDHRARRVRLLRRAADQVSERWNPNYSVRLYINCEGGIGKDDPDLKWLMRKGYLVIKRTPGRPNLMSRGHPIRYTYADLTEAGWDALWNERL